MKQRIQRPNKKSPLRRVREKRGLRRNGSAGCWPNPRRRMQRVLPRQEPAASTVSNAGEPGPSACAGGEGNGRDNRVYTEVADANAGAGE